MSDWLVCEESRSALLALDDSLRQAVAARDLQLRVMSLHLITAGGKRVRPALLFLAASFGRGEPARLQTAAAALELIHVASLYHDDIMDRAPQRRRGASINARWGNQAAAFAGTYLFARGSALLASLGQVPGRLAGEAAVTLCTGQLQEVENAFNLALAEEEHLDILRRKTAALLELPCRLGAFLAGVPEEMAAGLAEYGRQLGLAFQLADDALDLAGDAAEMGKATGTDLREGVYSLAVLRALRRGDAAAESLAALLHQAHLSGADIARAVRLVQESGAIPEALEVARACAARARAALVDLPDTPARQSLSRLAEYVTVRRQ